MIIFSILIISFLISPALAGDILKDPIPSLMLSSVEQEALHLALSSYKNALPKNRKSNHITLDGILFFSPKKWSIWINGKVISGEEKGSTPSLKILDVTASSVTFSYFDSKVSTPPICLLPHQSYDLETATISG